MSKLLIVCLLFASIAGCGGGKSSKPIKLGPGESGFSKANRLIGSAGKDKDHFHGNTESAKLMAQDFSEMIKKMQPEFFSGGKKNRTFSMTDDKFLTYCQVNENKVLFLVHVPQFKRYKGKTRDMLLELAWVVANNVTDGTPDGEEIEIAIGLKGSMMYGGSAIGKKNGTPKYENAFRVDKKKFYSYFVEKKKEAESQEEEKKEAPQKENV